MSWFKVDDKLHDHWKARQARQAMGLWVLAGSWCADQETDGFVPLTVVGRWGTPKQADQLVQAGLWVVDRVNGEDGYTFKDWEVYQPTKREKEEMRRKKSLAGQAGGKASGRSRRKASAKAGASLSVEPPSRTRPVVVAGQSSQLTQARALDRIADLTKGDLDYARKVVAFVTDNRPDVRDPVAYTLKSVEDSPANFRYHKRAPKRSEECQEHPGQYASSCAGCAADRLAGEGDEQA